MPRTLEWVPPQGAACGALRLIDQCLLPHELAFLRCETSREVCDAIARLAVRGAPAIGCAGAYALVLWACNEWPSEALHAHIPGDDASLFMKALEARAHDVATVRPTAVNLSWAVERCMAAVRRVLLDAEVAARIINSGEGSLVQVAQGALLGEARAIEEEDAENCRRMGVAGAEELARRARELGRPLRVETHCNAGSLATAFYGTALSVVYHAHAAGNVERVWVDETRPLDQGARLTTWELARAGVPHTLLCDSMAGSLMQAGQVDAVIVGADRVCANGDFANKVGTYPLAVLAARHGVPFYVAAPRSTFDERLACGEEIVIEQRDASEVLCAPVAVDGVRARIAPQGCAAYNPAFDVTPHELVTGGFITEEGLRRP